jgi:hypothetical protein
MGMDNDGATLRPPIENWPAPGEAYTGFGEQNQRAILRLWGEYMLGGDPVRQPVNGQARREAAQR